MNSIHEAMCGIRNTLISATRWSHTRAISLNKGNNELEQAIIRVVITMLVGLYGLGYVRSVSTGSPLHQQVWGIFGTYAVFTLVSLAWVITNPAPSVVRRITAMIADISILSYAMGVSGQHGAAWYPAYLWVTFGNGFRYGTAYLHVASALSVIGFGIVVLYSPFWGRYIALSTGLAIGLIILPIYVSKLLRRLESAIKNADAAKTEAEHANYEKSRFLANMSHELRTPLNGVIVTSDVLYAMQLNRETNNLVHTIQSSAQTLLGMINEILDIGKIESGRMDIEHTSFHLRSTMLNVHEIMLPLATRKKIGLRLYCDTAVPDNLVGDPAHVKQILLNVIGNAIKFTERGAVSIRVELDTTSTESVHTRFTISDSGIGIPEDARERIFEAFTQASSSVTRTHGGTGLGVTIAKELTELMGGTISLDSQVGIGTTFCLKIPFSINPEPNDIYLIKHVLVLLIGPDSTSLRRIFSMLIELGLPEYAIKRINSLYDIQDIIGAQSELSPVIMFDANINNFESILNELSDPDLESRCIPSVAFNVTNDLREHVIRAGVFAGLGIEPVEPKALKRAIECCVNFYDTPAHDLHEKHKPQKALKILAADDNKINRDVLNLTLSRAGHRVDLVGDGDEALHQLMNNDYDVVVLDMNMGEISGLAVIQEYKMLFPTSTLPFILLTADATQDAKTIADENGFSRYITKPFRAETLITAVEDVALEPTANSTSNETGTSAPISPAAEERWIDDATIRSLRTLAGSDAAFLKKLYEDYVSDAGALITKMEVSLISHQYEDFLDIAHALKGSSGHIGAQIVYQRCTELSDISVSEICAQGPDLLKRISEAVNHTNDLLFRALCDNLDLHRHG